jgi:hypothetical protein
MINHQEESGRFSFFDLPAELRNDIHREALFSPGPSETWRLTLVGGQSRCKPLPMSAPFHGNPSISTLRMLSAVSKQVCDEAQSLFWSTQRVQFTSIDMLQHAASNRFLTNIDPAARVSIKELSRGSMGQHDSHGSFGSGQEALHNLLDSLALCTNLQKLRFDVCVANIFIKERGVPVSHFSRHKNLHSRTLEKLANTLASRPRLQVVQLAVCRIRTEMESLLGSFGTNEAGF